MTPTERTLRTRIGAFSLHAQGKTNTGPARAAFNSRWEREVDPDGLLPERERQKRAAAAKSAYYSRLALKSVKSRGKKRARQSTAGQNHPQERVEDARK